ncbi:MAG: DivIVA domain-containing protein [Acutalibacteraceae bacterium]
MLTPRQLKSYSFTSAGRNSYRASEVDAYMEEISRSYEQMFHENAEMVKKLNLLADKLAEFRADENNIRNALLEAQRMKNQIIDKAEEEARDQLAATKDKIEETRASIDAKTSEILDRAQEEADKIIADAKFAAEETNRSAQAEAEKKVRGAQKVADDMLTAAQEEYDKTVGSVARQAELEKQYLEELQKQSEQLRRKLINTYSMEIELLNAGSDDDARREVLKKYENEAVVTRPEIDSIYTDPDLASNINFSSYVEADDQEETETDTASKAEEAAASLDETKKQAAAVVEQQTEQLSEDMDNLMKKAEEVAGTTLDDVSKTDGDDEDDDEEEGLGNIDEYLTGSEDAEDNTDESASEDTPTETYHYFDSDEREED